MGLFNKKTRTDKRASNAMNLGQAAVKRERMTVDQLESGDDAIRLIEGMLRHLDAKEGVTLVVSLPQALWNGYIHLGSGQIERLTNAITHTINDKFGAIPRASVIVTKHPHADADENQTIYLLAFPFHSGFGDYNETPEYTIDYAIGDQPFRPAPAYRVFNDNGEIALPCGLFTQQKILWIARQDDELILDPVGDNFESTEHFLVLRRTPDGSFTINGQRVKRSSEGVFQAIIELVKTAHPALEPDQDESNGTYIGMERSTTYNGAASTEKASGGAMTIRLTPVKKAVKPAPPKAAAIALQWVAIALPEGPEAWRLTPSQDVAIRWDGTHLSGIDASALHHCPVIDCGNYRINHFYFLPTGGESVALAEGQSLKLGKSTAPFALQGLASISSMEGRAAHLGNYYCSRHAVTLNHQPGQLRLEQINPHSSVRALDAALHVIDAPIEGGYLLVGCYLLRVGGDGVAPRQEPVAPPSTEPEPVTPTPAVDEALTEPSTPFEPSTEAPPEGSYVPSEYVAPVHAHLHWCGIVAHRGPSINAWRIDAAVSDLIESEQQTPCAIASDGERILINGVVLQDQLMLADITFVKQAIDAAFDLILFQATGDDPVLKSIALSPAGVELGKQATALQAIHLSCPNQAELSDGSNRSYHSYSYRSHHCTVKREGEHYQVTEIETGGAPSWLYDNAFNPADTLADGGYLHIGIYLFQLEVVK